ncbi:hypothetical protein K9L05_03490, partial [Candidatus Babeliales bacterium]|nr:hypothetical protein [Candidatus Babeliales bacterium]
MKKIFLFILFYSTFLGARDEMGRWVMLGTARNGNQTNPMSFDIRFNEIEDVTQPYGWRFGEPWPRIAGGDFINVGQIISIGPNKSLDLQNTVIPQAGSKGHPSEKRIEFKGVGEQTNEYGGLEYFEISPGTMLKLDALRGKAFAWLIQSISNRAVSFWAQTEGKLEIAIGSQIGPDYLLKIILGQKKSKIITKEEEQEEFAITEDNKQLIKYTDQVILQNIKTGKVLSFNYVKNIIESGAYSENLNKIPKKSIWTIKQTYKPYKQQDKKKDVFLEHGKTIALFNDDKYLSGRFGGATSLEPVLLDWEKWTIQKIDSSNSHIKNGDIIKLLSAHQAGYLVFDPNDIAANRWPQQNPDNIWKIMLAQAPEQKIYQRKYPLIKKEENARAMATPGFEGTYWISIIDNYLFVGSGYRPGEDLFFFKALPESIKGQTNFIGFGCKNKKAFYSNFMLSDPIDTVLPKEKYTDIPEIKPTAQFQILENMPLRISTKGSVSFQAKSQEPIYIGFFEKNDTESLKYKVALGKDNNTSVAIYKDKKESPIFKTYTLEKNILSNDKFDDFLISINDGLITVFKDRKLILAWQDSTPAKSYQNVGLSTKDDNAKIKNIEISAPITVESQKMEREYREKIQAHQTIDNVHLKLVAPYTYWLRQSGFNLEIEDPVYTNRTWKLFALEKMGEHNIMVSISKSGIPDIRYKHDPTGHPLEKILRIGANVLGGTGAALSQIPNPKVQAAGLVTGIAGQTLGSFTDAFFAETKRIYTEESRKIQAESIEEAKIKVYTEN